MQTTSPEPLVAALEPGGASAGPVEEISERERQMILWLTNISHAANHFQGQMLAPLYTVIMADLGFGFAELGIFNAIRNIVNYWAQLGYGFLTPFFHRCRLLAFGNLILAVGTAMTGVAGSFVALVGIRCFAGLGSSAQHPIGASLLASYFPKSRGTVLALNNTISAIGGLLAPVVAGALAAALCWRLVFWIVAPFSVLMGVAYFFFQDKMRENMSGKGKSEKIKGSISSYIRVFKNRNMLLLGLTFMVGASGRGGEDVQSYLGPHMVNDLGMGIAFVGLALSLVQLGGLTGPLLMGWISDRTSRVGVIQVSLVASALATFWLAHQNAELLSLIPNLMLYGALTHSRGTLTQALVADSVPDADQDAAFSVYFFLGFFSVPIWSIAMGLMMEHLEFSTAFSITAFSYLAGCVLMFFVKDKKKAVAA